MDEKTKYRLNLPWKENLVLHAGRRLRAALNRTEAKTILDLYRFARDGKFGDMGSEMIVGRSRIVCTLTKGWRKKINEALSMWGLPPIENARCVLLQIEKESFAEFERGLRRFLKDRGLPHDAATLHRVSYVLFNQSLAP